MAKKARSEAKQQSDKLRNIRRRYERASARALKQADAATTTKQRAAYLKQAEQYKQEAQKYYIKNITKEKAGSEQYKRDIEQFTKRGQARSGATLSNTSARNKIAESILKGNVLSQFLAATVQLWRGAPQSDILKTIQEKTGFDLLSLLEKLSKATGLDFFKESFNKVDDEKYNVLQVRKGMLYIAQNF